LNIGGPRICGCLRTEAPIIKPEFELVVPYDPGNAVGDIDLMLERVEELACVVIQSERVEVGQKERIRK